MIEGNETRSSMKLIHFDSIVNLDDNMVRSRVERSRTSMKIYTLHCCSLFYRIVIAQFMLFNTQ